ncbi:hypothetical protein ACR03S_10190 [Limimaricola variabilis]
MDAESFIETYGLPGAVIIALVYAVAKLWTAYTASNEGRLQDQREHARETRELAQASNASLDALTRMLEREGRRDP